MYCVLSISKHQRGPVARFLELVLVRIISSQLDGAAGGGGDGEGGGGGGRGGENGKRKEGGGGDGDGGDFWKPSGAGGGDGGGRLYSVLIWYGTPAAAYASSVPWNAVLFARGTISKEIVLSSFSLILTKPPAYSSGDIILMYERALNGGLLYCARRLTPGVSVEVEQTPMAGVPDSCDSGAATQNGAVLSQLYSVIWVPPLAVPKQWVCLPAPTSRSYPHGSPTVGRQNLRWEEPNQSAQTPDAQCEFAWHAFPPGEPPL